MLNTSQRIKAISFLAIIAVVIGHSPLGTTPVASAIEMLCISWTVPWFLVVSGYFLYYTFENHTLSVVLKKKVLTLIIPYILWCLFSGLIRDGSISVETFGLVNGFPCANMHLWYLHALICLMLSAIFFKLCTSSIKQKRTRIGCLILFVLMFKLIESRTVNFYGHTSTIVWFAAGYMIAANRLICLKFQKMVLSLKVLHVVLMGFAVISLRTIWYLSPSNEISDIVMRVVWPLGAIAFLWIWMAHCSKMKFVIELSRYVFFVYCFHGIILSLVGTIWLRVFGSGTLALEIGFAVRAGCTMLLSFALAMGLRRFLNPVYAVLAGGR